MSSPPGNTGPPIVGETLEYLRNGFDFIDRRVAKHGPVFKSRILGAETAFIVGPEACAIWTNPDLVIRTKAQPKPIFQIFAGPSLPHLDGEAHRLRKERVLSAFTADAVESYRPRIEQLVTNAFARWKGAEPFAWIPELKKLAIECIAGNFLGLGPGPTLEFIVTGYGTITRGLGGLPIPIPGTAFGNALSARDRILALYREEIRRHRARPREDGLTRILNAGLDDDAAMRELHHIIVAGYIIFAEFAWMAIELGRRPEFAGRAREDDEFLARVVMETKRMCPILPSIFGKARREIEFGGATIPAGWNIFWALRATNMDAKTYTVPEKFDPDRFSPERAEHKSHEHAYVPHGPGPMIGTHQCPGTDYATVMMKIFAQRLLEHSWRFENPAAPYNWSLVPPEPLDGLITTLS